MLSEGYMLTKSQYTNQLECKTPAMQLDSHQHSIFADFPPPQLLKAGEGEGSTAPVPRHCGGAKQVGREG